MRMCPERVPEAQRQTEPQPQRGGQGQPQEMPRDALSQRLRSRRPCRIDTSTPTSTPKFKSTPRAHALQVSPSISDSALSTTTVLSAFVASAADARNERGMAAASAVVDPISPVLVQSTDTSTADGPKGRPAASFLSSSTHHQSHITQRRHGSGHRRVTSCGSMALSDTQTRCAESRGDARARHRHADWMPLQRSPPRDEYSQTAEVLDRSRRWHTSPEINPHLLDWYASAQSVRSGGVTRAGRSHGAFGGQSEPNGPTTAKHHNGERRRSRRRRASVPGARPRSLELGDVDLATNDVVHRPTTLLSLGLGERDSRQLAGNHGPTNGLAGEELEQRRPWPAFVLAERTHRGRCNPGPGPSGLSSLFRHQYQDGATRETWMEGAGTLSTNTEPHSPAADTCATDARTERNTAGTFEQRTELASQCKPPPEAHAGGGGREPRLAQDAKHSVPTTPSENQLEGGRIRATHMLSTSHRSLLASAVAAASATTVESSSRRLVDCESDPAYGSCHLDCGTHVPWRWRSQPRIASSFDGRCPLNSNRALGLVDHTSYITIRQL